MTIAVDLGRKATKTNKQLTIYRMLNLQYSKQIFLRGDLMIVRSFVNQPLSKRGKIVFQDLLSTLENLCTRTSQSSRGVRSRRVHKIDYFGLL